ncbi:MAG: hypothetical protein IPO61_05605 [Gammaproteobacteria bacterium]|nr:hypothetical protein [Gammaproteobacteria bacterium]
MKQLAFNLRLAAALFVGLIPLRLLRRNKKQDIEASSGASEPADALPAEAKPRTQHDS